MSARMNCSSAWCWRSQPQTSWPRRRSSATSGLPSVPRQPVTRIFAIVCVLLGVSPHLRAARGRAVVTTRGSLKPTFPSARSEGRVRTLTAMPTPEVAPVLHVVGTRPNFMKAAPVWRGLEATGLPQRLAHTGQHYDTALSDTFFEVLALPPPSHHLGVGSGTHAEQTARVMLALDPLLAAEPASAVVVYGDVNSSAAAALVAAKRGVSVVHVEAGLRSRDRTMPEEHNRIVIDHLGDLLLTPSRDADDNLLAEGIPAERIAFAGNTMVDSLLRHIDQAAARGTMALLGLEAGGFVL